MGALTAIFDPHTKNNLQNLVGNLSQTSASLAQMMNAQSGIMAHAISNVDALTGNLAKNNDAITSSIRNIEVTTSNLANANIQGTVAALQATINELKNTIGQFNSNKGTLGLLMKDRVLYDHLTTVADRLNSTALSAQVLLDDVRIHPKRYVNISVFGGKTKGEPLTSPAVIDTVPARHKK